MLKVAYLKYQDRGIKRREHDMRVVQGQELAKVHASMVEDKDGAGSWKAKLEER